MGNYFYSFTACDIKLYISSIHYKSHDHPILWTYVFLPLPLFHLQIQKCIVLKIPTNTAQCPKETLQLGNGLSTITLATTNTFFILTSRRRWQIKKECTKNLKLKQFVYVRVGGASQYQAIYFKRRFGRRLWTMKSYQSVLLHCSKSKKTSGKA